MVEVRKGPGKLGELALPEMSIGKEKHEVLVRTAEYFRRERHSAPCPVWFDVIAIDNTLAGLPRV